MIIKVGSIEFLEILQLFLRNVAIILTIVAIKTF